MTPERDHGGGIDAAIAQFGGQRETWLDLSTGINPIPYPVPKLSKTAWSTLPDKTTINSLENAASKFWNAPIGSEVVAAGGASAIIAALPRILTGAVKNQTVNIPRPTYNEHLAAFTANGWSQAQNADVEVLVHPNNPDGRFHETDLSADLSIVDESFCDMTPEQSFVQQGGASTIVLKSFGKFWGLAGLRLGFAICPPEIAAKLRDALGPWQVSGPACEIGTAALTDRNWAQTTRDRLKLDTQRLDSLLSNADLTELKGTDLFRLATCEDANSLHTHLANQHILTRKFPYSDKWLRFGLPGTQEQWQRLEQALEQR